MQTLTNSLDIQTEIEAITARIHELEAAQQAIVSEMANNPDPDLISLQNQHSQNLFLLKAAQTRLDHLQTQHRVVSRGELLTQLEGMLSTHFDGSLELDISDMEILKMRRRLEAMAKVRATKQFELDALHRRILDLNKQNDLTPESRVLLNIYSYLPLSYVAAQRPVIMKSRVEGGMIPSSFDLDADTKRHEAYLKLTKG